MGSASVKLWGAAAWKLACIVSLHVKYAVDTVWMVLRHKSIDLMIWLIHYSDFSSGKAI